MSIVSGSSPSNSRKKCIFCGANYLTKQHLYPKWSHDLLKSKIDADKEWYRYRGRFVEGNLNTSEETDLFDFLNDNQVKCVCGARKTAAGHVSGCNNTWMSEIEDLARPVVRKLMVDDAVNLEKADQVKLATWMALMTFIHEWSNPKQISLPSSYRHNFLREFKKFKTVSSANIFSIWIFRHEAKQWAVRSLGQSHYVRDYLSFYTHPRSTQNTTSCMYGMGNLAFLCVGSTHMDFVKNLNIRNATRLWPNKGDSIDWSKEKIRSDEDLWFLARITGYCLEREMFGVRWGAYYFDENLDYIPNSD